LKGLEDYCFDAIQEQNKGKFEEMERKIKLCVVYDNVVRDVERGKCDFFP
jgi:hypothetical protein